MRTRSLCFYNTSVIDMLMEKNNEFNELFNTLANSVRNHMYGSKCYSSGNSGDYKIVVLANECIDEGQVMIDMEELEGYIDNGYEFYDLECNKLMVYA